MFIAVAHLKQLGSTVSFSCRSWYLLDNTNGCSVTTVVAEMQKYHRLLSLWHIVEIPGFDGLLHILENGLPGQSAGTGSSGMQVLFFISLNGIQRPSY